MLVSFLAALLGFLITGVQSVLIYTQGEGVCFNDGCRIVDSLTLVDPLYFNLVGAGYFLILTIGLSRARKGSDLGLRFTSLLLLAGLAAEAVLLAFQLIISQALCSYCLIILGLIVLANLFLGLKQLFKGIVIFSAIMIASFSLDYHGGTIKLEPLEKGTMASYRPNDFKTRFTLFISSSCTHCQSVLTSLETNGSCAVDFNPVDRYDTFSFPDAQAVPGYQPEINLGFLKRVGITEVPVLLHQEGSTMTLISGEQAIKRFIDQRCRAALPQASLKSSGQLSSSYSAPLPPEEDGCTIEEDCEDGQEQSTQNLP